MKPDKKQIKEIAEHLECGNICYFNTKTGEIKWVPQSDGFGDVEEFFGDIMDEVKSEDYFEFEIPDSRESYKIMESFLGHVENETLRDKLIDILNRKKPFRNFKWQIDNSGPYRQKWFDHKSSEYINWVKTLVELHEKEFINK